MWTVLKIDKKNFSFLKKDFEKKLGKDIKFYSPRIFIEKFKNNKRYSKSFDLLGDYIFCFNKKFIKYENTKLLKYSRGLKYFLNGSETSQTEIENFVEICKKAENDKGIISNNLFDLQINKKYKFLNGPFVNQIFKLIEIQKNRFCFSFGNFKSYIDNKNILIRPI